MKYLTLAVLAAAGLVCAACEHPVNTGGGGSGELHIRVTAPGFGEDLSPLQGVSQNTARVATNGSYVTTFENGDEIGITVVNSSGQIVTGQGNIKFRYDGSMWTADSTLLKFVPNATYLAYYPYSAGGTNTNETAIITNFTLPAPQNTPAAYASADLMTWSGSTPSSATLNVQFAHKMALVEVEVPSGATDVVIKIGATDVTSNAYLQSGVYRYIVRPQTVMISETYTITNNIPVTWKQNASLSGGSYTKATVGATNNFYAGPITVNYSDNQNPDSVYIRSDNKIPYTRTNNSLITSVELNSKTYLVGRKADIAD